jgi:SAM-dependent methyltransferase
MDAAASWHSVRSAAIDRYGPARWLQPAWRAIAAEIALSSGAFLDLGADHGWVCIHVAAGKPELDAIGLEPRADRRARAEANRQRRLNCTFKDVPPTALTFPAETFEVALALGVAGTWPDPGAVLAEVHRVLRPDGRLLVYDPVPDGEIPPDWLDRRGGWPPDALVRAWMRRHALDQPGWDALKAAVKASPFGGGEEGRHGLFRRLVLRKT